VKLLGRCASQDVAVEVGGGSGGGKDVDERGMGGDGSDDGDGRLDPTVTAILAGAGRTVASFPDDFSAALLAGKVSKTILERYIKMDQNVLVRLFFRLAGFRERLLADPGFLFKVAVECGIGLCTKTAAEYTKRQENFWKQLDFVAANVIMAILADFMLVWLPAPTLVYNRSVASSQSLFPWFKKCPDNAFQVVQRGTQPFTALQRLGSVVRNGSKLFAVGVVCSFIGVATTNSLLILRSKLDPQFKSQNPPQNAVNMAFGYGAYMATSSNLRYQILAGIVEERGIEVLFRNQRQAISVLSFLVRTGNTFLGSLLWVDFCRITGLQKMTATEEKPPVQNNDKGKAKR